MSDSMVYLISGVGLISCLWVLIVWNKFTRKAYANGQVLHMDAWKSGIQIFLASMLVGLAVWLGGWLSASSESLKNLTFPSITLSLLLCGGGPAMLGVGSFLLRISSLKTMFKYRAKKQELNGN